MNLIMRLLWLLTKYALRNKKITPSPLIASKTEFRVWLHDIDINLHLTNSRYLSFMDLGRTWLYAETGFMPLFLTHKWAAIVNAAEITFIREFSPFTKFTLETKLVGWDEKYLYFEQRFMQNGRVHAIGQIRGLFANKGKVVPSQDVLSTANISIEQPILPETTQAWKHLLDTKKRASLSANQTT